MTNLEFHFIEPELSVDKNKKSPASYIKRMFSVKGQVRYARVYLTALGVYRAYINGKETDNSLLNPGYTDYKYRVQYREYDIKDSLHYGSNELLVILGDGWYRGCINIGSTRNSYGKKTALAFVIQIEYEDGSSDTIFSDKECIASQSGPLRENDLKTIERYDARLIPDRYHEVVETVYSGKVIPLQGEKICRHEEFTPIVLKTANGETVLDFGQNFAGFVHFKVTGSAGHEVLLTHGECLDENGNFTMKNLAAEGASFISGEVGQRLEYVLKDGYQEYEPLFLYCGFRYVKLENWPEEVLPENFKGIAIYSDLEFIGDFKCSNEKINKLVENVRWSLKSNFVDIPGDCPTRERTGWSADISVFSKTACYLSDCRKFLLKWLEDYKLEQTEDGNLPFVIPDGNKNGMQRGCFGWSSSIADIALTLYEFYGDAEILRSVHEAISKFIDFNLKRAKKINPLLLFKKIYDRNFVVETGFHYGEWLEPGTKMYKDYIRNIFYPDIEVTCAYFYHTARQLELIENILGKECSHPGLADKLKEVYKKNFLNSDTVSSERQCRYVRPLWMDISTSPAIAESLNRICIKNDYKIGTGFLTTWQLLPVLTKYGYSDTAYKILENEKQPGWLYELNCGATTTWENWYGIDEKGSPVDSHNHYAPGSVISWLFEYCAGIKPLEPGFKKVRISPVPGGGLKFAEATFGKIVSAWKIENNTFILNVKTPVEAEIILPDGSMHIMSPGCKEFCCIIK